MTLSPSHTPSYGPENTNEVAMNPEVLAAVTEGSEALDALGIPDDGRSVVDMLPAGEATLILKKLIRLN